MMNIAMPSRKRLSRLHNKGLIYRGERIINWCPRCQTALSDEEAEHKEKNGKLYYIKYPLKSSVIASEAKQSLMNTLL